ncbi:MAG: HAD-IA family hydrolase [Caldilineaceae bacterium]|nr:HAD-IA family hydrolase [Caldilineaceae bacterium]
MTIRAVIFDRDGVLTYFDTGRAAADFASILPISIWELAKLWQQYGNVHGFPASLEAEEAFFRAFWTHVADLYALSPARREQLFALDYARYVVAYPDARRCLEFARQRGLRVGVLSNFSLASLDATLVAAQLADLVDVSCAATVIGAAKPDRAAYLAVTKALAVEPHECLFFDDEVACVEGGLAAGLRSYLVDRQATATDAAAGTVHDLDQVTALLDAALMG